MENNKPEMWVEGDSYNFFDRDEDYAAKETGGCMPMLITFGVLIVVLIGWGIYAILT